eukprot:6189132-Pleurochrysis_carterae.AAC.2
MQYSFSVDSKEDASLPRNQNMILKSIDVVFFRIRLDQKRHAIPTEAALLNAQMGHPRRQLGRPGA